MEFPPFDENLLLIVCTNFQLLLLDFIIISGEPLVSRIDAHILGMLWPDGFFSLSYGPLINSCITFLSTIHINYQQLQTRPQDYKTFSMLNSAEHEIYPAHKC